MHPRVLLLAALIVLAGCSASPNSPASDASAETELLTPDETEAALTETTDSAAVTDSTRDCSAVLYLEAVEPTTNETALAYGNLSTDRKAEFDMALVEGSAELGDDGEEFWADRPRVEHDGNVYRADVAVC